MRCESIRRSVRVSDLESESGNTNKIVPVA